MAKAPFTYERVKLMPGFDGRVCKIYPCLTQTEKYTYMTYGTLLLSGSDVAEGSYLVRSVDGGKTFGEPEKLGGHGVIKDGIRTIFSCPTEYYSKYHKKWFVFGCNISYENDNHPIAAAGIAISSAAYIFRDEESGQYIGDTIPLPLPFECVSATPCAQVIEYENGDFLLSFHIRRPTDKTAHVLTARYAFCDGKVSLVKAGTPIAYPNSVRGVYEPSVARSGDFYYVTLRSDEQGLFAVSSDGFNFSDPEPWKWDNGSILENYNTMQRWIQLGDQLYLAYTRKGANNDHVFRHRAPIFMAKFDAENRCLVKDTEVILVPELGARLGNFTVANISENEKWLLTAEWMQPIGCEKYGSDNSIWIAKVRLK